jgi:hypothetical protein
MRDPYTPELYGQGILANARDAESEGLAHTRLSITKSMARMENRGIRKPYLCFHREFLDPFEVAPSVFTCIRY